MISRSNTASVAIKAEGGRLKVAEDHRLAIGRERQANAVNIGRTPNLAALDAANDRMLLRIRRDDPKRAFVLVIAVVADPGFAQNLPAEAAVPLLAVPAVFSIGS